MYLYFPATAGLYSLTLIAFIFFIAGVFASVVLWKKGKAKSLHHGVNIPAMISAFIFNCVFQVHILKISFIRWLMHFCIFIGFIGLFAQTSLMAIMSHMLPKDSFLAQTFFDYQGGSGAHILDVWGDVFGVILLSGLIIALVRRYVIRSKQLDTVLKDTVAIVLLTIIVVTGFMCEAFRLMDPQFASVAAYSFAGSCFAGILKAVGIGQMNYVLWVILHALVSLFFVGYIPFSKAWHIFVSPIEIVLDASERA